METLPPCHSSSALLPLRPLRNQSHRRNLFKQRLEITPGSAAGGHRRHSSCSAPEPPELSFAWKRSKGPWQVWLWQGWIRASGAEHDCLIRMAAAEAPGPRAGLGSMQGCIPATSPHPTESVSGRAEQEKVSESGSLGSPSTQRVTPQRQSIVCPVTHTCFAGTVSPRAPTLGCGSSRNSAQGWFQLKLWSKCLTAVCVCPA